MVLKEKILHIIYEVIDETNSGLPADGRLEKTQDAVLFGSKGKLDSMGLVHFIVAVEERLHDDLGLSLTLADENAMSQKSSPFRTVSTLSEYIGQLMKQDAG